MNGSQPPPAPAPALPQVPVVSSDQLLGSNGELRILHQGAQYVLRMTRLGKLILTK